MVGDCSRLSVSSMLGSLSKLKLEEWVVRNSSMMNLSLMGATWSYRVGDESH